MKKNILALDLGTKTGWAIQKSNGLILSGTNTEASKRYEGGGMRYLRFENWLTDMKNNMDCIDIIYFEEVRRHVGTDAAHVYGGYMATLTKWAEHHEIPYAGIPVGTIKRFITGKGNASKSAVIEAVISRGYSPIDDNEADAIALLLSQLA